MDELNRRLYAYDNLEVLNDPLALPSDSVDLIYLDPPFNSNSTYNLPFKQLGRDVAAVAAFQDTWAWGEAEDAHLAALDEAPSTRVLAEIVQIAQRVEGRRRKTNLAAYLVNMAVRLIPMQRVLKPEGCIYLHCDPTASHYLKLLLDALFGRARFVNEIVWTYGLGGSSKRSFSRKHDVLLFYSNSERYFFDKPTVPATSNRLKGQEKGMLDVWTDIPSLNNMARERLGYPTQKPLELLERIVGASSRPGDLVLDPFCGCGTTAHAAELLGRRWVGIDISRFSAGLVRERLIDNVPTLNAQDIEVFGVPTTIQEARALAANDKFEFEKWVCGEIGAHGMYHNPGDRGADAGVDGVIEFYPLHMGEVPQKEIAIVQVKGGNVTPDSVRALYATVDQFGATAGIFVCFADQMTTVENNRSRRIFSDDAADYPVIQGYSIEDLLERKPLNLPVHRLRDDARLIQ